MALLDTIPAPAKVNLTLAITGRRDDGFHLLNSLVAFTSFGDQLEITLAEQSSGASLRISGAAGSGLSVRDNLVLQVGQSLAKHADREEDWGRLQLHLMKEIPVAAGLGGGSSDAAAIIRFLCRRWSVPLQSVEVRDIALSLGADIPMCLDPRCQQVGGIGEEVIGAPLLPEGLGILLVHPGAAMPTPPVFRAYREANVPFQRDVADAPDRFSDLNQLVAYVAAVGNDLLPMAQMIAPEIGDTIELLQSIDSAAHVSMSGSGATCFALFETLADAEAAARRIGQSNPGLWARTATLT